MARALSVKRSAVTMWYRGGIPPKHHAAIAKLALDRSVSHIITREVLDEHVRRAAKP